VTVERLFFMLMRFNELFSGKRRGFFLMKVTGQVKGSG